MSFHGVLLRVLVAMAIYALRRRVRYLALMDCTAPLGPEPCKSDGVGRKPRA
jgi:prolipoprotein diacylglyceryltransferase